MKIKVLGSGCTNCHKLYEETLKAVKNMGKDYEVEYITDIKVEESWTYGFVGTAYTTKITATAYPKK